MPYALQTFEHPEHHAIRSVLIKGEPWFVLADVCGALAIANSSDTASRLDQDEKGVATIDTPGGRQRMRIVNESGLYSVILRSEKAEAKRFKKWITSEVLPSIRKTGTFSAKPDSALAEWQPFHDRISLTVSKVPEGYFCIFKEMADLTAQLISQGATVNDETVPDISLGIAWGKEWELKGYEHDFGPRTKYEHSYPSYFRQARSNPQWPWCYPEEALGVFRRWMRNSYLQAAYPKYLSSKEKKGDIPAIVVKAALKAVEASRPKPLR